MRALRAFQCHKEMDDRNDGEPDGSPFFVCPAKGAAAFFAVAPLITQLQKRARCYFLSDSST